MKFIFSISHHMTINKIVYYHKNGDRRGRDCMVAGLTTTYTIGAYHHWCVVGSSPAQGEVYNIMW